MNHEPWSQSKLCMKENFSVTSDAFNCSTAAEASGKYVTGATRQSNTSRQLLTYLLALVLTDLAV